jgi:predicted ester cyclase
MSTEENKAIIRRLFEEGVNQNKLSVLDELIAPDFVNYDAPPGTPRGPQGMRLLGAMFRTAFPDLHVTFEQELADGDYVIHRGYITGTHQGEFQGIPPTGKQVKMKSIDIWRIANGKAVENWVQFDLLGLMQQLGVIPAPGHGGSYT